MTGKRVKDQTGKVTEGKKLPSELSVVLCGVFALLFIVSLLGVIRKSGEVKKLRAEMSSQQEMLDTTQQELTQSQKELTELRQEKEDVQAEADRLLDILENNPLATALLDVDHPAYADLYPDFYAPQPFEASEFREGVVFLTFDDGPSANTDDILKTLAKEEVKATFFVTGQGGKDGPARMKAIVDGGHTLAMHTYSHKYANIYESVEAYLEDMYQVFTLIKESTGTVPTAFRFPGGSVNGYDGAVHDEIIAEMMRRGFVPYDWNVSSEDATGKSYTPAQLADFVVNGSAKVKRPVVLMHDAYGKKNTATALPSMIRRLKANGFTFDGLTSKDKPVLFSYR